MLSPSPRRTIVGSSLIGLSPLSVLAAIASARAADKVDFNRDIRPLLSDKCYFCHGPDPKQRKAGLRLDDRAVAIKKKAIVPGKPDESELIDRLPAAPEADRMPPPETHKTLTRSTEGPVQTRWIAEWARSYTPHWAYAPDRTRAGRSAEAPNPIDTFILAKLKEKNIAPSRRRPTRPACCVA